MPRIDHARRRLNAANNDSNMFNTLMLLPPAASEQALQEAVSDQIKATSLALTRVPLQTWRRVVIAYIQAWQLGGYLNARALSAKLGINKATLYKMARVLEGIGVSEKGVLRDIIEEVGHK